MVGESAVPMKAVAATVCSWRLLAAAMAVIRAVVTAVLEMAVVVIAVAVEMVVAAAIRSRLGYHHVYQFFQSGRSAAW